MADRARVLSPHPENLALCGEALRRGELVAMPTETVYGLAGDAFNERALSRIFATKERPTFDPLIVHVSASISSGESGRLPALEKLRLVDGGRMNAEARALAERLMDVFWPGPLTLVLPRHDAVPDLVTSGLSTVAIRMPRHPVAQALIAAAGTPLAAPSANRFGRISPTSAADVFSELGDRIEWILDGGSCEVGLESTIVAVGPGTLTLLRPGGISRERIEQATGVRLLDFRDGKGAPQTNSPAAPGMLESHYAPKKPLRLLSRSFWEMTPGEVKNLGLRAGIRAGLLILFGDPDLAALRFADLTGSTVAAARTLSRTGDWEEAARMLFSQLRALDSSEAEFLFSEPCLEASGLGHAIGDRLRRAGAAR